MNITVDTEYKKVWNDSINVHIYANEVCQEHEISKFSNLHASKKKLLGMIASLDSIPNDVTLVVDNIVDVEEIIVLEQSQTAFIKVGDNKITVAISAPLVLFLSKL